MKQRQMNTKISRRSLAKTMGALGATLPLLGHAAFDLDWFSTDSKSRLNELYLSAEGYDAQHYSLSWINPNKETSQQILAGFRGHGLCQNPAQPEQVIMFSRRPGTQGIRMNTLTGKLDGSFQSAKGRHMHGHGCFSHDGKYLYCVESDFQSGKGLITVRDGQSLILINEFSSHGIGPHEIALMPDNETLVVANGGLLTHPDSGRKVLNYNSMDSTLSYINRHNGTLISEHRLNDKRLGESKASIRHLDVANDGTIAIALQVQRKALKHNKLMPLAAIHKPGQEITTLAAPETLMVKLDDYMGSVKIHNDTRTVAFTSPKGDLAMFWNIDDFSLQGFHSFHDVCGLAVSQDNKCFVLSNSAGKIRQINARTLKENKALSLHFPQKSWDNHLLSVTRPIS
jgi:hypothetical protein